jgi:hypothetical protein
MSAWWWLACAGSDDGITGDTSRDPPIVEAVLGEVAVLTEPGAGALQSHATVAWGSTEQYLVTWAVGLEPDSSAVAQLFSTEGSALADAIPLDPGPAPGAKPDVEWDGGRYVIGFTGGAVVALAAVDTQGALVSPPAPLHTAAMTTDVVDLALLPGGGGVALWTEYGAPGWAEDDGRIVYRTFDAALAGTGAAHEVDVSSRKTPDAAALVDGGWVGVWTRDYDHPSIEGEQVYEVWGRMYRGDGSAWTFRADDLDTAWPSRPAVAVSDDGLVAVSWRDKLEGEGAGKGSGAYVRLFDADGLPLGSSLALGEGHDGDRVVVAWAGELAVVAWQETDPDGLPGLVMSAVHAPTQQIVVDRLALHEPGGDRDERPSIVVRPVGDGYEVLAVWEAIAATGGAGRGLRARIITLSQE